MKKFGILVLAAIVGSAITIGATYFIGPDKGSTVKIEHISGTPAIGAVYTVNEEGEMIPLDFKDVAKTVMPAVVHIKSTQVSKAVYPRDNQIPESFRYFFDDEMLRRFFGPDFNFEAPQQRGPQARVGSGSGVIISSDGYIVTNNHVIDGADDIEVALHDNRVYKAKVIGTDSSTDLALIQIKEKDLSFIPFINSDKVEVGEWVLAVGNPFNLNSTVTAGIVSAKARNINILNDRSAIESFIQTDAAINTGNSGGALVNLQGGLIGINTAIASPTGAYSGYGFAIPSNIVSKVVEDLIEYGMVQRGYLGLMIRDVNGNLAKEKDLKVTEGVYVDSIAVNSAAGDAGVRAGDVIQEVNGVLTKSTGTLLEIIGRHRPGDEVRLKVNRNGKEVEYLVALRNLEGKTMLASKSNSEILDILGIQLEEIDKATARKLDIQGGLKITRLSDGKLKRYTDVKSGFIITKVDGKAVKSLEDFTKALEGKVGGILLEGVYENYPGAYYYAFGL
ncbi:MAG TPA: Do family serine endopeptidase [Bacteroidaceae bacterium]|nr:Do family serine endopeptidase [Bacteroidaceae bacterium]